MPTVRVVTAVIATGAALAGIGVAACAGAATPGATPTAARLGAYVAVAQRLYTLEASGTVGRVAARRLARDRRLAAAVRSGNPALLRSNALRQLFNPGKHVVRLSVVRRGRTLVDVGGRFVVASSAHTLPRTRGAKVLASVQDVVGYVKLFHRLTGQGIVVRGRRGHVEALPVGALHVAMPRTGGVVAVAGRSYTAETFPERGWDGERLRVTVFVPTPPA
jgi:hypothetical protein